MLPLLTSRSTVPRYLSRQNPESFDERIIFTSMFKHTEWTKEGNTETCLHNAKEVTTCATEFKPGHWCFLGPASENTWWNANSNESQGTWNIIKLLMVDMFECHTSHPIFPATEPLFAWTVEERKEHLPFQSTFDNKKILIKTVLSSNVFCIYNRMCQWYDTEILVPRRANRSQPAITQQTAENVPNSRRFVATTH